MTTKTIETKVQKLEQRVLVLERELGRPSLHERKRIHPEDTLLKEMIKDNRLQQQKRARQTFKQTAGTISRKRAQEMLRFIEQGRNAWK